ncbi:beta-galactosidase [Arthrobacter liuii]|uniref:beta-galactosidase n=1 Tax=Arthrobacter liuii TaxID=1476996 RepID=A0ABQ2AJF7_9MICC|nr:beta-galactosidase [Arthrobacter liuii]GGH90839.1 beta-galactosidase [Arthrobacter liuii]
MSERPNKVLFGAAYYHEYQPSPRLEEDLDLMAAAHMTVIRVGESTWSQWEPEDGRFDLEWMTPVLDGAHQRGISIILGTPTYAVPMWLARRYPEIAAETRTGQPLGWGARQEVDYTHPAFKFHAERVIRKIIGRFASHPAIIGYQVDNEPGLLSFHNRGVFQRFTDELRQRYGTVENLNKEWGLVYWSHQLSTWADLWTPDNNAQPQYDLAWRQFQAKLTTEYLTWQASIVREYATPEQFVTTCIAYDRPSQHDEDMTRSFDITAGNPYYAMQDALAVPHSSDPPQGWATSGAWTLFQSGDRMYSSKQAPFLVTETNAGAIGGSAMQYPAFDGQWRQAAYAFISRGAEMIEYWHWATNHYGTETYWIGVLPHDQKPGRVYHELAQLGEELQAAGSALTGLTPDARIGMIYSNDSKWALAGQPCFLLEPPMTGDERSYQKIFEAFYRGAHNAGVPVRILHDTQISGPQGNLLDPAQVAKELPVIIAAGLYIADDTLLEWLNAYARAGGHLVLGMRTAYADQEARARLDVKPARLDAGVTYQEFSQIQLPLEVEASGELPLSSEARATRWVDYLQPGEARVLARYTHPQFGQYAAVTTAATGAGRIITVGTLPDDTLAADLIRWLAPDNATTFWGELPAGVTANSATAADGSRIHFLHNWGWDPVTTAAPAPMQDLLDPDVGNLEKIELGPWDVRVLREGKGRQPVDS